MLNFQVKNLYSLWEKVFPVRADYKIVAKLEPTDLLDKLHVSQQENFISLLSFQEPIVRAVIHEAKFHHNEKAWALLGTVLSQYLKHFPDNTLIIPIPLSHRRLQSRGYNQVTMVAKQACKQDDRLQINETLLFRGRDTVPQTSLTKKDRIKNVANAFGVRDHKIITLNSKQIIILDDVATTGATLKAAKATLSPHLLLDTKSICVALAH